jgi:hypothetical protein
MISNLQFRFRYLFFDSHELFSRFSFRNPHSSTRWHTHPHGFVATIHEISGLADFSDNQTDMLPLELESKRDRNIELEFLDVGKTDRINTMVY